MPDEPSDPPKGTIQDLLAGSTTDAPTDAPKGSLQDLLAAWEPSSLADALAHAQAPIAPSTPKKHAYYDSADLYIAFAEAAGRLLRYARITMEALRHYKDQGVSHLPPITDPMTESMDKLLAIITRKQDVDFLKAEAEHAEALVFGQTAVSLWSALEVFVDDVVIAVLAADPSPLKTVKAKMSVAEFYQLDDHQRVLRAIELAKNEKGLNFSPGVGAFEPLFELIKLGGAVEDATKREILEFSAVRNCLAHRKGIVDERFLDVCPITHYVLGQPIMLTETNVHRYFWASMQYVATVLDRIKARYGSTSRVDSRAKAYLDELEKLRAPAATG